MLLCIYIIVEQLNKWMTNSESYGWSRNLQIREEGKNGICDNMLELETPV